MFGVSEYERSIDMISTLNKHEQSVDFQLI